MRNNSTEATGKMKNSPYVGWYDYTFEIWAFLHVNWIRHCKMGYTNSSVYPFNPNGTKVSSVSLDFQMVLNYEVHKSIHLLLKGCKSDRRMSMLGQKGLSNVKGQ